MFTFTECSTSGSTLVAFTVFLEAARFFAVTASGVLQASLDWCCHVLVKGKRFREFIKKSYRIFNTSDFRIEGNWVPFQSGLHGLFPQGLIFSCVQAIYAVATAAVRLIGKALAVKFEAMRFLAVAARFLSCYFPI